MNLKHKRLCDPTWSQTFRAEEKKTLRSDSSFRSGLFIGWLLVYLHPKISETLTKDEDMNIVSECWKIWTSYRLVLNSVSLFEPRVLNNKIISLLWVFPAVKGPYVVLPDCFHQSLWFWRNSGPRRSEWSYTQQGPHSGPRYTSSTQVHRGLLPGSDLDWNVLETCPGVDHCPVTWPGFKRWTQIHLWNILEFMTKGAKTTLYFSFIILSCFSKTITVSNVLWFNS